MSAVDLMCPLIDRLDSSLQPHEKEKAFSRLCSVYGENYGTQENLRELLELCVRENKINPSKTIPLEEGLTLEAEKKNEIAEIIKSFKDENKTAILEWKHNQPNEFLGRELERFVEMLERTDCVHLWGAPGVGKSVLAKQILVSRSGVEQFTVDLRAVESVQGIYMETLKQLCKFVAIEDATGALVSSVITERVESNGILLLFDNADRFVYDSGSVVETTLPFISFIKDLLETSIPHVIKIMITSQSRCEHPDASFMHQEELMSLQNECAVSIIKSMMLHEDDIDSNETSELVMKAIIQCRNLPLNLKILGRALQEKGQKLQYILPIVDRKIKELKDVEQREKGELCEEDYYTFGILEARLEQFSSTVQQIAATLSLFPRSFTPELVASILEDSDNSKIHLVLDYLQCVNILNYEEKLGYDMHPKVREFLVCRQSASKEIKKYIRTAKSNFTTYYTKCLVAASRFIDNDYIAAYCRYQESRSEFEAMFNEEDNGLIMLDDYDDIEKVCSLLGRMLEHSRRLELFQNLAESAFNKGKVLKAAQYLSHTVIEESCNNPLQTFDYTLLRFQHIMETLSDDRNCYPINKHLDQLYGLFYFVKGEVLNKMARSCSSLIECNNAIEYLNKSLTIRLQLNPLGHEDIAKSYLSLGRIYDTMQDIHSDNKSNEDIEECLKASLDVCKKGLNMVQKLSTSGVHVDFRKINQNIGKLYNDRGKLIQGKGGQAEDKIASKYFAKAEKFLRISLETDSNLEVLGLSDTSVSFEILGELQMHTERPEEAVVNLTKALEIRKKLKGDHSDIVCVMLKLGKVSLQMENFGNAVQFYKEAFEMEERLSPKCHSQFRYEIQNGLMYAYKMLGETSKDPQETERIIEEREEIENWLKQLEDAEAQTHRVVDEIRRAPEHPEPKEEEMEASTTDIDSVITDNDKFVDGSFDKNGGHVSFRYYHVFLTIPRNLTKQFHTIRVYSLQEDRVTVNLSDSEFIVSNVIGIRSKLNGVLKRPALLEINCNILESRVGKFSELAVMEYSTISKRWMDVEKIARLQRRFYWYNGNQSVPVLHAWIHRFSIYAVIIRPKKTTFSVPSSGQIWRPFEDGRIALDFPPGCFGEAANTSCNAKVVQADSDVLEKLRERCNVLLSPAINIQVEKKVSRAVKVSLPLLPAPNPNAGFLKILRRESNPKADWKVEELKLALKHEQNTVEFETVGFSWIMAVWSFSKDVTAESLKWALTTMFHFFQYDADIHLYKKSYVDDSIIIGIACTPAKTANSHWMERLRPGRESGYEHVISAPALQRLCDNEMISVNVEGQYINKSKPSDVDLLRFNSKNFRPMPIALRDSGLNEKGGIALLEKLNDSARICKIPYLENFKLVSDSELERKMRSRSLPIRFLGLKLENCGLECINTSQNFFRNSLYRTGLHESFIDELKLDVNNTSQQLIAKKLFDEITLLFVRKTLARDWFYVFRAYSHPPSLRRNLIQVMEFLESELRYLDWHAIGAAVTDNNSSFLQDLGNRLQCPRSNSDLDFEAAMRKYVDHDKTLMDLVRHILLLKADGYRDQVERTLNRIGEIIEEWMKPNIYQ